jgi:hypothetical protein
MTTDTDPSAKYLPTRRWLLTTAGTPWFWCQECHREIPDRALAASRPAEPHQWFCIECLPTLVLADDIADYERHKANR